MTINQKSAYLLKDPNFFPEDNHLISLIFYII